MPDHTAGQLDDWRRVRLAAEEPVVLRHGLNIWAEPKGHAWSYQAAYDLVLRLRARTGIAFDPHWWRHSAATRWLRDGVPIEVVSTLLGHSSVAVTSSVYGHLTAEDARAALEKAGWFTGKEVSW